MPPPSFHALIFCFFAAIPVIFRRSSPIYSIMQGEEKEVDAKISEISEP